MPTSFHLSRHSPSMQRLPKVSALRLANTGAALLHEWADHQFLTSIHLSYCSMGPPDFIALATMPNLRHLALEYCTIDTAAPMFGTQILRCRPIDARSTRYLRNITSVLVPTLTVVSESLTTLRSLHILRCSNFSHKHVERIAENSALKELTIRRSPVLDDNLLGYHLCVCVRVRCECICVCVWRVA